MARLIVGPELDLKTIQKAIVADFPVRARYIAFDRASITFFQANTFLAAGLQVNGVVPPIGCD
jgi:hypothetical protein